MSQEGKVDYLLFKNHLEHELRQLDIEEKQQAEIASLIPFSRAIIDLEEAAGEWNRSIQLRPRPR